MKASKIFSILFLFFYFGTSLYAAYAYGAKVTRIYHFNTSTTSIKIYLDKTLSNCDGNAIYFYLASFPNFADIMKSAILNSLLTGRQIDFSYDANCKVSGMDIK